MLILVLILNVYAAFGQELPGTQYPFMVSIKMFDQHLCSGALIHPSWVITAAHCVYEISKQILTVEAGGVDIYNIPWQERDIEQIQVHRYWNHKYPSNNLALLKTNSPFDLNEWLKIIAVSAQPVDNSTKVVKCGWNYDEQEKSHYLQHATTMVIDTETCARELSSFNIDINESYICTKEFEEEDVCVSDGGSFLLTNFLRYKGLFGIVAWQPLLCRVDYPELYTHVYAHHPWISAKCNMCLDICHS